MAGEKSVLSGEAGQKITKRLLELCGWNISEHIDFSCTNGENHKSHGSKNPRTQHSLDGIQCYDSPLNHLVKKLVCISAKHHIDEYPNAPKTKMYRTAKELAQCTDCARESPEISTFIFEGDGEERRTEFDGLVTFFSSSPEEKHISFFQENGKELSVPSDDFDTLFFIDNKRATFIYSAIVEAIAHSDDRKISFVYPDTGTNQDTENITPAGKLLPLELMCSDILPILVQKDDNCHVLIFCNDEIEKKYLKRVVWLVHRLCPFASRTYIYFPNYDPSKHETMVSAVKQEFQESNYVGRIHLRKWDDDSFIKLKDDTQIYEETAQVPAPFSVMEKPDSVGKISEDYDKILPFGSKIKPILASSILSASDLKDFLKRKGIFVKYADKELIVPIFANLLLSPRELDFLKGMLVDKEEKPKSVNKSALFLGEPAQLKEAVRRLQPAAIKLKANCKHLQTPKLVSQGDNRYEIEINIERTNTTKDLISGKTRHDGRLTVLLDKGKVNVKMEYTSNETKKYLEAVAADLSDKLKDAGCIQDDLRSIRFKDFPSNAERVEFLTGFKDIDHSDKFFKGEIVNIKFKPDENIPDLPYELKSYRGKVKNLDINGSLLEELPHIGNIEYQNAILLSRVKIKYWFSVDNNQGLCIAEIGFPSTLNGRKVDVETDLEVSVEIFRSKGDNITGNIPRLQNRLSRLLDQIVLSKYQAAHDKIEPTSQP